MSPTRNKRIFVLTVLVILAAFPAMAQCPSVTWSSSQHLTGYVHWVEHLRPIDYDHDGKMDLVGVVRSQNQGAATILHSWRGTGTGTFEAAVSLGTDNILEVEVANVNNDLYPDLVLARAGNGIGVRLGNASGGFDAVITTFVNYVAYAAFVTNWNGDAFPDLLVSSFTSNLFVLYTGNGDGTFTELRRETVPGTFEVWKAVAADFDQDSYTDVAITKSSSDEVAVYYRNANGTFGTVVTLSTGDQPRELAVADINNDAYPDLVATAQQVEVFRNNGIGTRAFTRTTLASSTPGSPFSTVEHLAVVDVNGDSIVDILAGGFNTARLLTFIGRGDGVFGTPSFSVMPDSIATIALANFNGADSGPELAMGAFEDFFNADLTCATQVTMFSVAQTTSAGQPAKLRAHVSGVHSFMHPSYGSVTFKEGATTLGTANVDANGLAKLDYSGFSAGEHTLTAEYETNGALASATSAPYVQKVLNQTSSIAIALGTSLHGEPFNSTVTITNRFGSITNGYYYLTLDGVTESRPRHNGAPLTLTLNAGPHTITGEYIGDAFDPASTSPTYNLTTTKVPVTVSKSGDVTQRAGTAHSFVIQVSASTSPFPSGTVEIFRGAFSLGTATLSSGAAVFNLTLPRGSAEYTAVYSGDAKYLSGTTAFTLNVVANSDLAIDAYPTDSAIAIPAVVPGGTTNATMYRRVNGTDTWIVVASWSLASSFDTNATRGVLYDYRLEATVSGVPQLSNIDSAVLFTDPTLTAANTVIKLAHFTEARDAINALRAMAGFAPFAFDGTFGPQAVIRASHLTALRNAVTEARTALGMFAAPFTDGTPAGLVVKAVHVNELRNATR